MTLESQNAHYLTTKYSVLFHLSLYTECLDFHIHFLQIKLPNGKGISAPVGVLINIFG